MRHSTRALACVAVVLFVVGGASSFMTEKAHEIFDNGEVRLENQLGTVTPNQS